MHAAVVGRSMNEGTRLKGSGQADHRILLLGRGKSKFSPGLLFWINWKSVYNYFSANFRKLLIDLDNHNNVKDEPDDANVIMSSEDEQKYSLNHAATTLNGRTKNTEGTTSDDEIGPPLPPRPPPRHRFVPSADTGNWRHFHFHSSKEKRSSNRHVQRLSNQTNGYSKRHP